MNSPSKVESAVVGAMIEMLELSKYSAPNRTEYGNQNNHVVWTGVHQIIHVLTEVKINKGIIFMVLLDKIDPTK